MFTIEVRCQNEDKKVAVVETDGPLTAMKILSGAKEVDVARWPERRNVAEHQQMLCRRCGGNLYFKTSKGDLFTASPGSVTIEA